ncbi:Rieske (2Fe-2S) protein [Corynebacterium propinquum]|uniref:Rieske (2Fe-2S) protein n=1 Tax=Corynebacterium propinquum TaxID=43769 RepID=A0AAP4F702_9CORY|nr:Rieske (2Fe-2S) protein [Corynebacterium propinquum]MDK4257643.1 Rieske (2Fe-2S) protein [Corynebacterium propinquum]MDK4281709.1 Rieske (2Fe-2S) protein [Corynebacterium propinquum]MDK4298224.1 Rieske (2Fe-2S) protein [Corynebacterium propinquum]MDK4326305.1 Rieske (2Fe-2S) protein [Corynebacterium propinquum]MDK8666778.1 Rieske (2Fe-2S) protein [Corynebacterium propinquum]
MAQNCSRRLFLLGTATTVAGAFLAACGEEPPLEVAKAEVPVGSAIIADGYIIAQPEEGKYVAYSQQCPHQRNLITKVEGDEVRCTAHNSVFKIADGSVVSGPARDPLEPVSIDDAGNALNVHS